MGVRNKHMCSTETAGSILMLSANFEEPWPDEETHACEPYPRTKIQFSADDLREIKQNLKIYLDPKD